MSLAAGENAEGDKANIELDTSATAEATAIGIESDGDDAAEEDKAASPFGLDGLRVTYEKETTAVSGADSIANVADVQAVAVATSGAGSASMDIDVDGTVQSKANSEAKSVSVGISSGGAQDAISNSGDLNATATATAGALSAAVRAGESDSGSTDPPDPNETNGDDEGRKTSSESQATATARAVGVDSDGKGQTTTLSAAVEVTDESLILTYRESEAFIGESDHVTNLGNIQAMATAETSALNAAVDLSATGAVNSKANSHAKADGVGVNLGGGDDHLINTGQMTASADAIASALNVAIGIPQDSSKRQHDHRPENRPPPMAVPRPNRVPSAYRRTAWRATPRVRPNCRSGATASAFPAVKRKRSPAEKTRSRTPAISRRPRMRQPMPLDWASVLTARPLPKSTQPPRRKLSALTWAAVTTI